MGGTKGLQFSGKRWDLLMGEYADAVYSSLFCGLGDRSWLNQADFLLCVDAGVKDFFPTHLFQNVPQQLFENTAAAKTVAFVPLFAPVSASSPAFRGLARSYLHHFHWQRGVFDNFVQTLCGSG